MADYCLPRKDSAKFVAALKSGVIDPADLVTKSSAERSRLFKDVLGEENAKDVNALFESKLLLKNQQQGILDWIKALGSDRPDITKDLSDKVQGMEKALSGQTEQTFLADLVNKKLGVSVNAQEAQELFDASTRVQQAKDLMMQDIDNLPNRRAWGRAKIDLTDMMNKMKPNGMTFKEGVMQALGLEKQVLTGEFHFTAPIQQNWGLMTTKQWVQGIPKMFQYFANEENFKNLQADIISHPLYNKMIKADLGLTSLGDTFGAREEENISRIMERLNKKLQDASGGTVPNLFRASARGFTGFSNYVRAGRFVDLHSAAEMLGHDVSPGSQALNDIADAINDFSGRGKLPGPRGYAGSATTLLNLLFFAPRKLAGTIKMFNPVSLAGFNALELRQINPVARNARIRQLSGSLAATAAVLSLAGAFGYGVEVNPLSQDFLKVDVDGEKFDMTGGNALWIRLLARLAMGESISSTGKETDFGEGYNSPTRLSAVGNFLWGKLSPMANHIVDAFYGKNAIGQPFSLEEEARHSMIPIVAGQFIDYYQNNPKDAAAIMPSILSIMGISMQSPLPTPTRMNMNIWGEPSGEGLPGLSSIGLGTPPAPRNDLDKEATRLGVSLTPPTNKINGVKLSDDQYRKYIALSGDWAKSHLEPIVSSENWEKMPDIAKKSIFNGMIQAGRAQAQTILHIGALGSIDDILAKSLKGLTPNSGTSKEENTKDTFDFMNVKSDVKPQKSSEPYPDIQTAMKEMSNKDYPAEDKWQELMKTGKTGDITGVSGNLEKVLDFAKETLKDLTPSPIIADHIAKAFVASRRNPIATLGFAPDRFAYDRENKIPSSIGGAYRPKDDIGFSTTSNQESLVHESIHRGLQLLKQSGKLTNDESSFINIMDESIARYVVAKDMGDPQLHIGDIGQKQREQAIRVFEGKEHKYFSEEQQELLKSIEKKASGLFIEQTKTTMPVLPPKQKGKK